MITVSASQDFTAGKLAVAFAYALGSGAVLYALMLGGRKFVDRVKPARAWVQAATGAVMVAGRGRDDRRPRPQVPERDRRRPAVGRSSTRAAGSRQSSAVADDLAGSAAARTRRRRAAARRRPPASKLPDYGPAPDFADTGQWFNTDGEPLSIAELTARGPGGADRLLDLHLHQLHPHPART